MGVRFSPSLLEVTMWTILRYVSKGEYIYAVIPEHPYATKNGYVLAHRAVIEISLGRLLKDTEVVHHKNHNKRDNRLENLEVMDYITHARLHAKRGRAYVNLICPVCKKQFKKEARQIHSAKPKCSRHCNGIWSTTKDKSIFRL